MMTMPAKSSRKTPTRIVKKQKNGLSRLIIIVFAIIIALIFIVFSTYKPIRKKPSAIQNTTNSNPAPVFRKDGSLSIILSKSSSPLAIDIEIADDDPERMRGLMDRLSLPEMAGMLFIFEKDEPRSFWMKNTFISLDIIYINSNKEIVSIQKYTQPKTTSSIPSEKPAKYVLEVNAGFTDKYEISPGDKIEFSY
jgi:uncharacterized membrane protein (UPF0127 family)